MGSGLGGVLCQTCYGMALVLNMLWAAGLMKLTSFLPMDRVKHQEVSLFLLQVGWRLAFVFAPWINFEPDEDYSDQWTLVLNMMAESDAECKKNGEKTKPLFVMGNHTSFLDTVLAVCKFPTQVLTRCRTYMNSHLFKTPVLASVCRFVGHFPVYFKSDTEGAFQVDQARMVEVEEKVNVHLAQGGWMCFFPEGTMNKNPGKLLPFRFGGMKKALEADAMLCIIVFHGNQSVWPIKSQIGGLPGKVRYSMRPVSPFSAREFVKMAKEEGCQEEKDMKDHEILGRRLHELMQSQYDALAKAADRDAAAAGAPKAVAGAKQD